MAGRLSQRLAKLQDKPAKSLVLRSSQRPAQERMESPAVQTFPT